MLYTQVGVDVYDRAGLSAVEVVRTLAQSTEPIWCHSETAVAPCVVYALAAA